MLDNEPVIFGYRGKIESAGVCIQDARRRALVGDAPRIVHAPRQRRTGRRIDHVDLGSRGAASALSTGETRIARLAAKVAAIPVAAIRCPAASSNFFCLCPEILVGFET